MSSSVILKHSCFSSLFPFLYSQLFQYIGSFLYMFTLLSHEFLTSLFEPISSPPFSNVSTAFRTVRCILQNYWFPLYFGLSVGFLSFERSSARFRSKFERFTNTLVIWGAFSSYMEGTPQAGAGECTTSLSLALQLSKHCCSLKIIPTFLDTTILSGSYGYCISTFYYELYGVISFIGFSWWNGIFLAGCQIFTWPLLPI